MTSSQTAQDRAADPVIRGPAPAEIPRVLHLFQNRLLPPQARLLAAERTKPIERFVAAAAWWVEGTTGRFHLACQPGVDRTANTGPVIERVVEESCRAGLETVQYAELLPTEHEWAEVLRAHGFNRLRSERSFEVAYRDAWTRVMRLHQKYQSRIPQEWWTDAIQHHPPEVILDLIAPYRLLPPAEVRQYWQAGNAGGFDLELSCILFDGQRPFGAFLARRWSEIIYIEVQVVQVPNARLRSLGDLCLLYHDARRVGPDGPIRWIRFRSGETEHRQTANLALRMGGREVPPRHVFGRRLTCNPTPNPGPEVGNPKEIQRPRSEAEESVDGVLQ